MSKTFIIFAKDIIYTSIDSPFNKFYYRSRCHVIVTLLIASGKGYSYEKICKEIPGQIGSRTTIKTILNQGIKNGFFEKKKDNKDKRAKKYYLNKLLKVSMKNWEKKNERDF